jgi:hypothetical protein
MTDHEDFHTMPALSRRAFLAGLMAVPAAAAVPGLGEVKNDIGVWLGPVWMCRAGYQDISRAMIYSATDSGFQIFRPPVGWLEVYGLEFVKRGDWK